MPIDAEAFLLLLASQWFLAALTLLALGVRAWRRGWPGGKMATAAAVAFLALPLAFGGLIAAVELGGRAVRDALEAALGDDEGVAALLLAAAAVPVALSAVAMRTAFRAASAASRGIGG